MKTKNSQNKITFDKLVEIIKIIREFEKEEGYSSKRKNLTIIPETYIGYPPKEIEFENDQISYLGYNLLDQYGLFLDIRHKLRIEIPIEEKQNFKQIKDYVKWISNIRNNQ